MPYAIVGQSHSWRRHPEGTAASAAIAVHAAVAAFLLISFMGAAPPPRPHGTSLVAFNIGADAASGSLEATQISEPTKQEKQRAAAGNAETKSSKAAVSTDVTDRPPVTIENDNPAPAPTIAEQGALDAGEDARSTEPQMAVQTGEMTLGVRATGNAGASDAALAGAISAAIANQIRACWQPPVNLGDDIDATANRRILVATFAPDGALSTNPTVYVVHDDFQSEVTEPDVIEEAAIAALERCAPIKLPSTLYPYWQQVELELFPKTSKPEIARADI